MKLAKNGLVNNMDLFTYLMAKNNQNTQKDLFSYLLGKGSGGSGTYTTFSGTSLNISNTIKAKIKNFMLNSTELTQDGTPTPDNPVDVNVITGDNNIKITDGTEEQNYPIILSSDNLFDFDNVNITRLGNEGNVSVSDNEIVFTATGQEVFGVTIDLARLNLKDNTTYTISNLMDNTDVSVNPLGWRYFNGSSYTSLNYYQTKFTFTTSNSNVNRLLYYVGAPKNYDGMLTLSNIQLEEGSTATEYAPYHEPIEYCKIGDYVDQFFKNTTDSEFYDSTLLENEWYLKKNIGKIVLNGSESGWTNAGGNAPYKYTNSNIIMSSSENDTNLLSNYYPCKKWSDSWSSFDYMVVQTRNGQSIQFRNVNISTLEDFKVWLSTHNTTVYYPLETPTYIHISQADYPILRSQLDNLYNNAKSYNGQTNITQTNENLPFNISVDVKVS